MQGLTSDRKGGMSKRAKPIVSKCVCLLLACPVIVTGCGSERAPQPQAPPVSVPVKAATRQVFGEFSFEVPNGWTSVTPDREKTRAALLFGGPRWDSAKGMLKVDVGVSPSKTAQEMATAFAQASGGQIDPTPIDVDGEKAVRVTTSSSNMSMPRLFVTVFHDGRAFLIMAASTENTDVSDAFEQVRTSWKWEK
jgi:hypothetical protein